MYCGSSVVTMTQTQYDMQTLVNQVPIVVLSLMDAAMRCLADHARKGPVASTINAVSPTLTVEYCNNGH